MISYDYVVTYGEIIDDYEKKLLDGTLTIRHQVIKYSSELYIATLVDGKVFNFSLYMN